MDHTAANALIDAVETACLRSITEAVANTETAHAALVDAVRDAYNSGIPSRRVADTLGWSRATYYRYLADNGITVTPSE